MKKIKIFKGYWKIDHVKNDIDKIYVFGDNDLRIGKGGQAIIRDLDNSMGIRTKKGPSKKSAAFYSDDNIESNREKIREDILNIKYQSLLKKKTIVLSNGGYGTGLSNLKEKAPQTFEFLNKLLSSYFNFDNERGVSFSKIPGHDEIIKSKSIDIKKETITPVNNTLFKEEYLSKGLYTNLDLIKNGVKTAFTSTKKLNINEYLILNENNDRIVCKIIDSYKIKSVIDKWNLFEGYSDEFNIDFDLDLYQTQIEFICTLDKSGKMIFNDDLFGEPINDLKKKEPKIEGTPIKVEKVDKIEQDEKSGLFNKKSIKTLLSDIGIKTDKYNLVSDKNSKFYGLWEVKHKGLYFYFKLKKGILKNKINLIFVKDV